MRYSSKVDGWLVPVMVIAIAGLVAGLVSVFVSPTPWPVRALTIVTVVVVTMLLFSVFRNTWYEVGTTDLRIVSGPLKWKIPISEITEIRPTRNPLSSPALSLDRLKISYGRKKFVLVSPADKEGFVAVLEKARHDAADGPPSHAGI